MTRLERDSACKVNFLLNILGKRPDGFHELETLMHPVPLFDRLSFERRPGRGVHLTCNHPDLPIDSSNLVTRAAVAFLNATALPGGVRIHLEKLLPLAAGLGGGSANAATTLLALNELFGQPLSPRELHPIAASLGSDVAFFLQPLPALATGRGEQIEPLDFFPALRDAWIFLVHPGFGVSTAWAYQALAAFPDALHGAVGRGKQLVALLQGRDPRQAGRAFGNSLEAPVLRKYPVLRLYQDFLNEHGAFASLMSGSGSTTFALFENEVAARTARDQFCLNFGERGWTAVTPLANGPSPISASSAGRG